MYSHSSCRPSLRNVLHIEKNMAATRLILSALTPCQSYLTVFEC